MMDPPMLVPYLPSINSSIFPMDYNNSYNGSNTNGSNINMIPNMNMSNMNMNMSNVAQMANVNLANMANVASVANAANMANMANMGFAANGMNINSFNMANGNNGMNNSSMAPSHHMTYGNNGNGAVNTGNGLVSGGNGIVGNGIVGNGIVGNGIVGNGNNGNIPYYQPQYTPPQNITLPANTFIEKVSSFLPVPPLMKVPNKVVTVHHTPSRRSRRRSKFTKQQDEMIINLKHKGKNWVEIAEITKVGSYLAARNRYQVIIGQQGNNNLSSWSSELNITLKKLLDKYEIEKWRFITNEFNKIYNKNYDYKEIQMLVGNLFMTNPYGFGINDDLLKELIKERKLLDKDSFSKGNEFDEFLNYHIENENEYE